MNWSENQQRFSIRRFTVGTASVLIGLSFLGVTAPSVQADDLNQPTLAQVSPSRAVSEEAADPVEPELSVDTESIVDALPLPQTASEESTAPLEVLIEPVAVASQTLAEQFNPQGQDVTIASGQAVQAEDFIREATNLPAETRFSFITEPALDRAGNSQVVRVLVSFPDGSSAEVSPRLFITPTLAQANLPEAVFLRISVGQNLQPSNLIKNATSLPEGTQFSWEVQPNVNTPGGRMARVLVSYTDGSYEYVTVRFLVDRRQTSQPKLKQAPTLTWQGVTPSETETTATASYRLVDPDNTVTAMTVAIYQGGEKISEQVVTKDDLASLPLTFPEWDTDYTIKTSLTYNTGTGATTVNLPDRTLHFEYKKLEIKDIDSLTLYRHEGNQTTRVTSLETAPADVSNYFVRVTSDRFRDMLLPVRTIREEVLATGGVAFRVTTDMAELVEDADPTAQSRYDDQLSFLVQQTPTGEQVYTTFSQLVDAIKTNLSGNFVIGADLFADEVTIDAKDSHIMGEFKGSLTGLYKGQQFAIYNLKNPLFHVIRQATISHLDLKNVAISTTRTSGTGSLANQISNSTVTNVSVQGSVSATQNLGGLTYLVVESTLDNTSFTGQVTATGTKLTTDSNVGGLVGALARGTVQNSFVNADITVTGTLLGHRTGGLVGFNNGTTVNRTAGASILNVYSEGRLTNLGTNGYTGGIVGSTAGTQPGVVRQAVNKMVVTNGKAVYGFEGIAAANMANAFTTTGQAQSLARLITDSQAVEQVNKMAITTTLSDTGFFTERLARETDYLSLAKASADRQIAYDNIEKLMPFYNKELIVKYGNLVDQDHKLYQTRLLSVTPMTGNDIVSDVNTVKQNLNRLMLNYEDGQVAYLDVVYKGDFRNKAVSEYTITGTKLIYTPEQFLSNYDGIVSVLAPILRAVDYHSTDMAKELVTYSQADLVDFMANKMRQQYPTSNGYRMTSKDQIQAVLRQIIKLSPTETTQVMADFEAQAIAQYTENPTSIANQMDRLYLEPTFDQVKGAIETHLRQILSTDKAVNTTGGVIDRYLIDYITANKEKLLMGLSYVTRWYAIDFQGRNIKDLATYHQDFFGKPVNTLEWLVNLGSSYETLVASNNLATYLNHMASNTKQASLLDYLSTNRKLFTTYADDNTWFTKTSKVYIVEQQSKELPERVVRVYDTLRTPAEQNGILPLLTAQEGIFIINSLGGITYGMFDRYYSNASLKNLPADQQVTKIKELVNRTAQRQGDHFDVWYRLANQDVRDRMIKPGMVIWDGYKVDTSWTPMFGPQATQATRDFFGPIGSRSAVANNNSGAYANGTSIAFVNNAVLDDYGASVYTHEVVHNNDRDIYLGGYGRREGMLPEAYALGLLQSSSYGGHAASFLTLNLIYDYSDKATAPDRYTNLSPDRFKTSNDLQTYMHGVFDVLYTLDYAEAEAAVQQTTAAKQSLYAVMENSTADSKGSTAPHVANKVRALTTDEANALTTWQAFIDGSIVGRREYQFKTYDRNGYYQSYLFTPVYSALSNSSGAPGDLIFRRIAFELMADKGYNDGFIPYTSNKLKVDANTVLTDDHVLQGIYGGAHPTWTDFKKAMFQERIDKLDRLTAVTITYRNRQVAITSYADIRYLMAEAMRDDVANNKTTTTSGSRVHELKAAIYNAYLLQTKDFETSIFKP